MFALHPPHVAGSSPPALGWFRDCATIRSMPTVSLKAHYDGKSIQLDEPFDLPANARLMVTLLPPVADTDREDWSMLSAENLARAYGEDDPEYSVTRLGGR
jgi:hypothetical protein